MIAQGHNFLKNAQHHGVELDTKLQQINFLDRRYYKKAEGIYYPSVTTVLQYMPKNKFFEEWLKDVGQNADIIAQKAAKEGTQVHNAVESLLLGEEIQWIDEYGTAKYSQLVWEMILKFYRFWTLVNPTLLATERFTFSDKHKYAGTADLVVTINNETWLLDIKTSNSLHTSYNLQLAAYAKALEESGGFKIDRTGILWLKAATRKEVVSDKAIQGQGWQLKFVDDIDTNFDLFQTIYKLYELDNPEKEPSYTTLPLAVKL